MVATRLENLSATIGAFTGEIKPHPDPKLKYRRVADGNITYTRIDENGQLLEATINIRGARVRRLHGKGNSDFRRYVRVGRGPREQRENIIGLIDLS